MKQATAEVQRPAEAVVSADSKAANDAPAAGGSESDRLAQALSLLGSLLAVWPALVQLTDGQRAATTGRLAQRYEGPLGQLFAMTARPEYAPAFALLRMSDGAPFDAATARAHVARASATRQVAAELRRAADVLDDDALHHGALAVDAGLMVLKIARVLADNNPEFRAGIGHALDEFRAMTAAARRAPKEPAADKDADGDAKPSPA